MRASPKREVRLPRSWAALVVLLLALPAARAEDVSALCSDRLAIERVYYQHRLGGKPPFGDTLPRPALEKLVRQDLKREAVLREHYGVAITPALLAAEVQRIDATTHAPETLAEIKAALGQNSARYAQAFAKPFLVERLLRDKFENDDALHAPLRRDCERLRAGLLAARTKGATPAQLLAQLRRGDSNAVTETTWQLGPRPSDTNAPSADEREIKQRFGPAAQLLSLPHGAENERKRYFEDLPGDLQRVLQVQLRQPGDVSAVVETPSGFLLYVCAEWTATVLRVAVFSQPKRSYEQWLTEQPDIL